jgi:hypothetical protein
MLNGAMAKSMSSSTGTSTPAILRLRRWTSLMVMSEASNSFHRARIEL